jgi:hypothetical protein
MRNAITLEIILYLCSATAMQFGQQWESLDPLMQISTLSSVSALQALSNNAQCCKPATLERMKIGEQGRRSIFREISRKNSIECEMFTY